jgi:TonB family protein
MLPNIGVKNSPNVALASNGQGSGGGMGTGSGGGLGSGTGNGYGPGYGGNTGGGMERIGGRVSAPVALNSVEAEFSDEARRAKYQGVCLISLIVDAQGNPQNPRVIRTLGMGLDEKALEAVRKYKFKPAMKDGKTPVPVMITVEVNFRLY